jgi:hypothetical protein
MSRNEHIVIRKAHAGDESALSVLAVLDGGRARPEGQVLVAESAGRLRAAIGSNGTAISDPFWPSADLVDMLRAHPAAATETRRVHAPRFAMRRPVAA